MSALTIVATNIRQDSEGRYSLSDCWKASGADKNNQPSKWFEAAKTQDFLALLGGDPENRATPFAVVTTGPNDGRGYWVQREAVIHYATWISPDFYLTVIRAFDAMVTGKIMLPKPESDDELILRALTHLNDRVKSQQEALAIAQPKAAALDRIAFAEDEFGLMETAKIIQVRPRFFTKWCDTNGWTYFRGKTRLAYQDKINAGFVRNKANPYKDANGEEHLGNTVRVTAKGIAKLAQIVPGALIDEEAMPPTVRAQMRRSKEAKEVVPFAKTPETAQ